MVSSRQVIQKNDPQVIPQRLSGGEATDYSCISHIIMDIAHPEMMESGSCIHKMRKVCANDDATRGDNNSNCLLQNTQTPRPNIPCQLWIAHCTNRIAVVTSL